MTEKKKWTLEEEETLEEEYYSYRSISEIAAILDRTYKSVKNKIARMNLSR